MVILLSLVHRMPWLLKPRAFRLVGIVLLVLALAVPLAVAVTLAAVPLLAVACSLDIARRFGRRHAPARIE